jgi:16S rRNA (guanine1516-N2)-methyltransferase
VTIHNTSDLSVQINPDYFHQSEALANRLQLPLVEAAVAGATNSYVLVYTDKGLALQQTGVKADGPVYVDYLGGASEYRRNKGGGELIVKAVSGPKDTKPSVLDVTAGLGRDCFVLASWGYDVTALERSPVVFSLLEDGLQRASLLGDVDLRSIVQRLQIVHADAIQYLNEHATSNPPDVVVIDPMFPPSKKSALVKKEMRAFHYVVGPDQDGSLLLDASLAAANYRVVVKRPKKAEFLAGKKPNFSLDGKAIRFDIYTKKTFAKK